MRAVEDSGVPGTVGCITEPQCVRHHRICRMLQAVTGRACRLCGALYGVLQDLWGTGGVP